MKSRTYRSLAALAIATTALAGSVIAAGPANADASTPPWEPDPSAVGTITFYDSSGNVVTGGSTNTAPFAAYAVGSTTVRAGDTHATIRAANPDPNSPVTSWFKDDLGAFSTYPLTAGPANIQTLSQTQPVAVGGTSDLTLDDFESEATHFTGTGYTNMVQLRMITATPAGAQGTAYDDADVLIDPTAHTFQVVYPAPTVAPTAPAAPSGVSAVAGNASATVTWTAPASNGGSAVTGYDVQYSSDGGATYMSASAAFNSSTAVTETVTGLTNGTPYVFRVAAINAAGTGAYSGASTAVTPVAPAVPAAPSGVTASAGNASARVTWTAPSDNGGRAVTGYDVQYSSDGGATYTSASAAFNTNTAVTETVTGLTNGTSYVFRVAAINAIGTSAYSSASTAVTPVAPTPPAPPAPPAPHATTISITAPATVVYGKTATISTVLTDSTIRRPIASQAVTLYRRASASRPFTLVKSLRTSTSGAAHIAVRETANEQFEWRFTATSTHRAATSSVRSTGASQTVSIARTPSRVRHGASIKIYGSVNPAGSGKISLQRDINGKWRSAGTATVKRQKLPNRKTAVGYVFTVKLAKKGSYVYRVYKPATSTLGAGYSGKITARAS